ncbi:MAG: DNA-3-methyladenine glycosylase I [Gammaproteobacteria bacterium]|nr:DNA-3-methyladenine glycosylase I [Gammaproteobacteria bacterium]
MQSFAKVQQRAEQRKGGASGLEKLLPEVANRTRLSTMTDDRYLAMMTKCINQAGFNWSVIEKKWPQFEEAFYGFDPENLAYLSAEKWEAYMSDVRVVRNWQKISALRDNVGFLREVSAEHNGFGRFLAGWPPSDQVGLMRFLKKRGHRLGGATSQWFLRRVGKDGYILTGDVIDALQNAGVDIHDQPTSQADLRRVQQAFNQWHEETGLSYTHLSKIAAYSMGTNHDSDFIIAQINA